MAFTQETFAPVATNSTDAQAIYSYRSDDDISTVTSAGYFDIKKLQLNEKDWIMCELSDGIVIVQIGADTSTASVIFSPSPSLCPLLSLTNYDIGAAQTTNISASNQITATSLGNPGSNSVQISSQSFTAQSDTVGIEVTFDSFLGSAGIVGAGFYDIAVPAGMPMCGFGAIVAAGLIVDGNTGAPLFVGQTISPSYWGAAALDTSGSVGIYQDSIGNNAALAVNAGYNNSNPVYMAAAISASATATHQTVATITARPSSFNNTIPNLVEWCSAA